MWICGAGGGFGGGERARPPDLGVPFKAGFASISDAGLEAGQGAVREVMAAPILSPTSTSTFSPMSSVPASVQCVTASTSTASFATPASNAGAGGENGSEEVASLGGGRGGRGRGGMGWMGGGVAAPTNRPPTHARPPTVAMRSSIVSPSPAGGSTILGEHMRSGGSSVFERAPSGCSCVCVCVCVCERERERERESRALYSSHTNVCIVTLACTHTSAGRSGGGRGSRMSTPAGPPPLPPGVEDGASGTGMRGSGLGAGARSPDGNDSPG